MPRRVTRCRPCVHEAARALGTLVAQIANFVMPQKILLAGEGVGLVDVAGPMVEETILTHRHPQADPVHLDNEESDFHDWARRGRGAGHSGAGGGEEQRRAGAGGDPTSDERSGSWSRYPS